MLPTPTRRRSEFLVKINLEIDIPTTDVPALAVAIGSTPASFEQDLQGHAQAAVDEYVAMYLARETPTSGSELRQLRLALLAERVFTDGLPDEETVAGLFQLTLPASRTLIRNTMTRYRTRLEASMKAAGKAVMDDADWADDLVEISIPSASLVEAMNRVLARDRSDHVRISKKQGTVSVYTTAAASYTLLCQTYGSNVKPQP